MSKDDLKLLNQDLLEKLNLLDGTMLKRAAVLLFHRNPEKWITGSFVTKLLPGFVKSLESLKAGGWL